MRITRRNMLNQSATAATIAVVSNDSRADESRPLRIVDSNVSLFQWPFRRLPLDRTDRLVNKLTSIGITEAWAGSFEGLFHRDISAVNHRVTRDCAAHPMLLPVGTINLSLPGWEQDLQTCRVVHRMHAVRVFPNYHSYTLDNHRFHKLLQQAGDFKLLVQIAVSMEDIRTQSDQRQVPDVDLAPLLKLKPQFPDTLVQILNLKARSSVGMKLGQLPGVYFDIARIDGTDGVPALIQNVSKGRVLFGSHAPFLIPEAALIRTHESGQLSNNQLSRILSGNADALRMKAAV